LNTRCGQVYLALGWGGFSITGRIAPMNKEPRPRKNLTLSIIHLLDLVAAGAAVLVWVVIGAVSVSRWLLGG
jgi:hypothetical protein